MNKDKKIYDELKIDLIFNQEDVLCSSKYVSDIYDDGSWVDSNVKTK